MSANNELAAYYFHQGTNYRAYEYLGCQRVRRVRGYTYTFRTWAPNAQSVGIVSDFSGWDNPIPMHKITEKGIWELNYHSDVSLEKKPYKFAVVSSSGVTIKGDPYAKFSRGLDDGASLIFTKSMYKWGDSQWLRRRKHIFSKGGYYLSFPLNVYELHIGSFMRKDRGDFLSYRELADVLAPYAKAMGYTHVELLPVMEHPYDGSWGYQVGAFYAPTSRYGDPDDFRYFVDKMHKTGIGVILDWVPAHFPKDEWGLYEFDGQPLYEYQGKDRQESTSWGTRFFDLGREEVQSFLISNALYYLREFHVDGLRVDAVASMLYLDYDRRPGEWIPNPQGTNISPEALAFFKKLNTAILTELPDVLMIAEESGDYGMITSSAENGGLGFNLKWNMGWANDIYEYLSLDPIYRKYKHKALNFPIMYAFSENYCLPISHDEVVHGKGSLINKIHGDYEDKFDQLRCILMLMMTFPGKKLLFMGTEFAQFSEWDYTNELEWFMLDYPRHYEFREYVRALNDFYLSSPELWSIDFSGDGFEWISADEAEKNTVVYRRLDQERKSLIIAINFSGVDQSVSIPASNATSLIPLFTTRPGGTAPSYAVRRMSGKECADITLKKFSGVILKESDGYRKVLI